MVGHDLLRTALNKKDFATLAAFLKEASDAEEDLGAIVSTKKAEVLDVLSVGLKSEETHEQAVLLLSKIGARDEGFLVKVCSLLNSGDRAYSSGAAAVISWVCSRNPGSCAVLPASVSGELLRMLRARHSRETFADRRKWSRARAAEALGAMGCSDAVGALVGALGDPEEAVALNAKYALAGMRDCDRVVEEISGRLTPESGSAFLSNALWVLGRIALSAPGGGEGLRPLLRKLSKIASESDDVETQRRAVRAMLDVDREAAIKEISGFLKRDFGDRSERVWRMAVGTLARLADAGHKQAGIELREFALRMEALPPKKRPDAYGEARFALDVMEARGFSG